MNFKIRQGHPDDHGRVLKLYRVVAAKEGGLARNAKEITEQYVDDFMTKSFNSGVILVIEDPEGRNQLVAEIHAYRYGLEVFNHMLGELTIVVHPEFQGQKLGRNIFLRFLDEIQNHRPDILRVELKARESNQNAVEFYRKIGFKIEGRLENRIRGVHDAFEADIEMAWMNPNFNK